MTVDPFRILEAYRVAVREGGEKILSMFGSGVPRDSTIGKGHGDFALVFDVECQAVVRARLAGSLPDLPFVGEEDKDSFQHGLPTVPYSVLDPLDGTHMVRMFCQEWGILLCYVENGIVKVAVLAQPELGQEIYAVAGHGCFWNDKRHTIPARPATDALVLALPFSHALAPATYGQFLEPLRASNLIGTTRSLGCAAANVVEVLAGRCHGYINCTGANIWDLAVGDLLIREAGGQTRTVQGAPLVWDTVKKSVVYAANGAVLDRLGAAWGWQS